MDKFTFTYVAAHLIDTSKHENVEFELDSIEQALDYADKFNQTNGNEYVFGIYSESGEKYEVRNLYYFHWRLRMGSHANGNEHYVRKWYWAKDIKEAADFARSLNKFLSEYVPGKWKPWIGYIENQRDGSTEYL